MVLERSEKAHIGERLAVDQHAVAVENHKQGHLKGVSAVSAVSATRFGDSRRLNPSAGRAVPMAVEMNEHHADPRSASADRHTPQYCSVLSSGIDGEGAPENTCVRRQADKRVETPATVR